MTKIRRITAWIEWDEDCAPTDPEEAIQSLGEAVLDDSAQVSVDYYAATKHGHDPEACATPGANE